jgi:replicative DNA helicase
MQEQYDEFFDQWSEQFIEDDADKDFYYELIAIKNPIPDINMDTFYLTLERAYAMADSMIKDEDFRKEVADMKEELERLNSQFTVIKLKDNQSRIAQLQNLMDKAKQFIDKLDQLPRVPGMKLRYENIDRMGAYQFEYHILANDSYPVGTYSARDSLMWRIRREFLIYSLGQNSSNNSSISSISSDKILNNSDLVRVISQYV